MMSATINILYHISQTYKKTTCKLEETQEKIQILTVPLNAKPILDSNKRSTTSPSRVDSRNILQDPSLSMTGGLTSRNQMVGDPGA